MRRPPVNNNNIFKKKSYFFCLKRVYLNSAATLSNLAIMSFFSLQKMKEKREMLRKPLVVQFESSPVLLQDVLLLLHLQLPLVVLDHFGLAPLLTLELGHQLLPLHVHKSRGHAIWIK